MKNLLTISGVLLLAACGGGANAPTTPAVVAAPPNGDDTAAVQALVDAGGVINLEARTYHLSKTIVIRHSGTVIKGAGPATILKYAAGHDFIHCVNDRVITTPCDLDDVPPRRIAQPIAIGDTSFTATDDASDVQPGEWLLINDYDSTYGDRAAVDWMKVASVAGNVIHVDTPFRMAFTTARPWVAGKSGLGFTRVTRLVEGTELRNFSVTVPDTGNAADHAAGISIFMALNTTIDHVSVNNYNAQPLYCYLSKGVTITNSEGRGTNILNEFASSVDVTITGNTFAVERAAGVGLDLGLGFFNVTDNTVTQSTNIGAYLLYAVHDGTFSRNHIATVAAPFGSSSDGLLVWGAQNVTVSDNQLDGGAGPDSAGISVRAADGEIPGPSVNVQLIGNTFGNGWVNDYEPGTTGN